MPATRRVTRRPPEKPHSKPKFDFRQTLVEFLTNKTFAEQLILRNDGDKKKNIPGIKDALREYVIANGEVDPETGSVFLELDEPIDIGEGRNAQRYTQVKAEKRQGEKYLNADRARELLEKKGVLDKVEEYQYVLRLPADLAEQFAEWLKETDLITKVVSTDAVLVEDNLLELHHQRTGKKVKVDGKMVDERVISEKELDGLYDLPDATWAFKPLTS